MVQSSSSRESVPPLSLEELREGKVTVREGGREGGGRGEGGEIRKKVRVGMKGGRERERERGEGGMEK